MATSTQSFSTSEFESRSRSWADVLLQGPIHYFPVRHHSPACARHLQDWIQKFRPEVVVIECPTSLEKWIPSLLDSDCTGPVALLTTYQESQEPGALRHSAFYPLCDYSPEWIAIRHGHTVGAKIAFADMEFSAKVDWRNQHLENETPRSMLGVLLTDDSHFQYSNFIRVLTRKMGARDFDELWDQLFESCSSEVDTRSFVGRLATYCDLSRQSHASEILSWDSTVAREAIMAERIEREFQQLKNPREGSVLVVTGGFHTVALPPGLEKPSSQPASKLVPTAGLDEKLNKSWLVRYSYVQLDSLSGYQSGMPSPGFYDAVWRDGSGPEQMRNVTGGMISKIARETRGRAVSHQASVTDSIAAVQMMEALSQLRNHAIPTRHDLLDAVSACMRKESIHGQDTLEAIAHVVLAGDRIGTVPESVGRPPILDDFYQRAKQLRLPTDSLEQKNLVLELYRKPVHRQTSFFLHQLNLLGAKFGRFVDGPDFVNGYHLGKLTEQWSVTWIPQTDARLLEQAFSGESVETAALARLKECVAEFEADGSARSALAVVDLLIRSCRCGLHQFSRTLYPLIEIQIGEDGSFASMSAALNRLMLLNSAREPLAASQWIELPGLIKLCYQRASILVESLRNVPDDEVDSVLDGLVSVREWIHSLDDQDVGENQEFDDCIIRLDETLFYDSLESLLNGNRSTPPRSEIAGAVVGILFSAGRIQAEHVSEIVGYFLDSTASDISDACGVLRGLMKTSRESFWRLKDLLKRIDQLFKNWDDGRFANALPQIRLAFSQLSPSEVDKVAKEVAQLHAIEELVPMIQPEISEEDIQFAVRASSLLNASLRRDGLN